MQQPVGGETRVYVGLVARTSRLNELGVTEAVLRTAVEVGLRFSFDCTAHDPPSMAGLLAWGKTTRTLRDQLVPLGWKPDNAQNYATTFNEKTGYAIVVAAGDSFTGIPGRNPSTRSEKGPATEAAVRANQGTFADIDPSFPRVGPKQTWFLLPFMDEDAGMIRHELSLAADMTSDGRVSTWVERIILDPIAITSSPGASDDDSGDIDIDVQRRA